MNLTVQRLIELAGPLGPLAADTRDEELRAALMGGRPIEAAARILDAVRASPTLPSNVTRRDFEYAAAELLSELAKHTAVRHHLENLLLDPVFRSVAIDALALRSDLATGTPLAALATAELAEPFLNEDELIRLVSALGCVGGLDALRAVEALQTKPYPDVVKRELEIAKEALEM
jgi:hypothetical protein